MSRRNRPRRGIYLLPTIFTIGNLFCGFSSLLAAHQGHFARAAVLVIIAGVLDGLDGRIARLTGTTSEFGNEFDSLADMVSFGVAPAFLGYAWVLQGLGRLGWVATVLFVICAAMRLARFNVRAASTDKLFFAGLPSPSAAGSLACIVFAFPQIESSGIQAVLAAGMIVALGLLMVSRVRYRSFKEFDLRDRRSFLYALPLALIVVAIAIYPRWALLLFSSAYLASGPTIYLVGLVRRLLSRKSGKPVEESTEQLADDATGR